ncbi:hypothetical protein HX062_09830 [Myroides sp. DF42-4-2]|nr:hypothetical protein [Myroides sp. NP-2]MDM1407952.1 hypothetical protein [Myroides sp. DF42-4-2]
MVYRRGLYSIVGVIIFI